MAPEGKQGVGAGGGGAGGGLGLPAALGWVVRRRLGATRLKQPFAGLIRRLAPIDVGEQSHDGGRVAVLEQDRDEAPLLVGRVAEEQAVVLQAGPVRGEIGLGHAHQQHARGFQAALDLEADGITRLDHQPFVVPVALPGDDLRLENIVAFWCDGSRGLYIHPGIWHEGVFPATACTVVSRSPGQGACAGELQCRTGIRCFS